MNHTVLILSVLVAWWNLQHIRADGQDFQEQVSERSRAVYDKVAAEAQKLVDDRRLDEANKLWLAAVPDRQRTAIDYFILGNTLFSIDPRQSLAFHQAAARLQPDIPDIQFELGMSLHRHGRYKEAIAAYEAYLKSEVAQSRGPAVFWSLLADCRIREGKLAEACEAWSKLPYREFRVAIVKFAHEIHGGPHVLRRHADLLAAARKKDVSAAARVIAVDVSWSVDWWSSEVNDRFLKADIGEFAQLFPADDPTMKLMQCVADYHLAGDDDVADFYDALKQRKVLVGESCVVPRTGGLVATAVDLLLKGQAVSERELLATLKPEIDKELERPKSEIDEDLVNVYANLLARIEDFEELRNVNRRMWRKCGAARFAASYLVACRAEGKNLSDPEVAAIISQFPQDSVIANLALVMRTDDNPPSAAEIARAIAAEFTLPSLNPLSGVRTADRLRYLFDQLEKATQQSK